MFDNESESFALSDCVWWSVPEHECAGPRVGRDTDTGTVYCEKHYNEPGMRRDDLSMDIASPNPDSVGAGWPEEAEPYIPAPADDPRPVFLETVTLVISYDPVLVSDKFIGEHITELEGIDSVTSGDLAGNVGLVDALRYAAAYEMGQRPVLEPVRTVGATMTVLAMLADSPDVEVMPDLHPSWPGSFSVVHPPSSSAVTLVPVEVSDPDD
jgi:hypothetical protein